MVMQIVSFRAPGQYDPDVVSDETALICQDESMTQQSFKDESDINTIVRRFGLTGELPSDLQMPQSGDFTGVGDYHSAMNLVRAAQEEFLRVPADLRARFENDPARLMRFLDDESNREEAVKLGLVNAPPAPPVVPPAVPPSA